MIEPFEYPRGSYVMFADANLVTNDTYKPWINKKLRVLGYDFNHIGETICVLTLDSEITIQARCPISNLVDWEQSLEILEILVSEEYLINMIEGFE